MIYTTESIPKPTFSERHGGKIFTLAGILLPAIIGSTLSLVIEETFRTNYFEKYSIMVRLISLDVLPYLLQAVCGVLFLSCTYYLLRRIKNKPGFEPFLKTFISCSLILVIHLSIITGVSYLGASGFTAIAENGYLTVRGAWSAELVPWESISYGKIELVNGFGNRKYLKYTFTLRAGGEKVFRARITDIKSITEASWVFSRQNLPLSMDKKTETAYKGLLSILGE